MPTLPPPETVLTPAMRQYFAAKEQHPDCLMFCRMGDFYELFFEDAIVAARELQLTLTARDRERKQPMCGVPYHAAEIYIQRLLRKGYRIALCEQMEDPKLVKSGNVVRREVTRVLTPGTSADPALAPGDSCWLAAIVCTKASVGLALRVGLAMIDLSTGDFRATDFTGPTAWPEAVDELTRTRPLELIHAQGGLGLAPSPTLVANTQDQDPTPLDNIRTKTPIEDWVLTPEHALPLLRRHFGLLSLDGLGLSGHDPAATAAGALVHYLRQIKQGALEHLEPSASTSAPPPRARRRLRPQPRARRAPLLRRIHPDHPPLHPRHLLHPHGQAPPPRHPPPPRPRPRRNRRPPRRRRRSHRRPPPPRGRPPRHGRPPRPRAPPRPHQYGLRRPPRGPLPRRHPRLPPRPPRRHSRPHQPPLAHPRRRHGPLEDLHELITATIVPEPPATFADGGVLRPGIHPELDELRELSRSGRAALAAIEERERARTGIGSLKVRYNQCLRLLP